MTDGSTIKTTEYLDGFQYENQLLQFFPHSEGYVRVTTKSINPNNPVYDFNYAYNYTDHLGNIRLTYAKDPQTGNLKVMEENHYYPFGLKHQNYGSGMSLDFQQQLDEWGVIIAPTTNNPFKYKYNGKELQDELNINWIAMDARNYDAALGRFYVMDPLASLAPSYTPYRFGFNDPVYWADPTGMYEYDDDGNVVIKHWDEILFFLDYFFSGGSMDGLEMALQDAGYALDLEEATITGSPKSKNNNSQYIFSNRCIAGCHQTPGMQWNDSENPFFKRTKSETFYWLTGGHGPGLGRNPFMKPGDKVEFSDLLEWLSASKNKVPSSKEIDALQNLLLMYELLGSEGSGMTQIGATETESPQSKDTVLNIRVREANSAYRGSSYVEGRGFGRPHTLYRSKDTIIHTTTDKVERIKSLIDSIDNSRL